MTVNYAEFENMKMPELIARYKLGTEAERALIVTKVIMDNDKLITHLLKKHFPSYIKGHYDDMCQEGRIAISQHFADFQPEKGKFSTYIGTYILEAFKWYICSLHGISSHYFTRLKQLNQAIAKLKADGHTEITADLIAEEMGVGLDAVLAVMAIRDRINHISIEGDEKEKTLFSGEILGPEEQFERMEEIEALRSAVRRLPPQERKVIIASYLNDDERELPLRDVGRQLEMDSNTVRRLKNRALRQLKRDVDLTGHFGGARNCEVSDFADALTIDFVISKSTVDENLEIAFDIDI